MGTIRQLAENFDRLNFNSVVQTTLYENEVDILGLNAEQMQEGKGKDGANLKNSNKKFTGVYKRLTQEYAENDNPILPKRAGELYNFGWTGKFLSNLDMNVSDSEINIFSTGTGTGAKKLFFDGYKTLFGLNSTSSMKLIEDRQFQNKLVKNLKDAVRL